MSDVYIVTSGSYSDYGIHRVFLTEERARAYSQLVADSDVEIYEADDDKDLGPYRVADIEYAVFDDWQADFRVTTVCYASIDSDTPYRHRRTADYYYDVKRDGSDFKMLHLSRQVPLDASVTEIEDRYLRVCQDLFAQIRSLIEVERWSPEMVDEWLADKGRWEGAA